MVTPDEVHVKNRPDTIMPTDVTNSSGPDSPTKTYHAHFTEGGDTAIVEIVTGVATVLDREVMDMPPLFDAIDAGALGELVTSPRERPVEVSFSYQGCRVTVSSCGDVLVEQPGE